MFLQQMYANLRSSKDHVPATMGDLVSTRSPVAANGSCGEAAKETATASAPKPPATCAAIHLASRNVRTHNIVLKLFRRITWVSSRKTVLDHNYQRRPYAGCGPLVRFMFVNLPR